MVINSPDSKAAEPKASSNRFQFGKFKASRKGVYSMVGAVIAFALLGMLSWFVDESTSYAFHSVTSYLLPSPKHKFATISNKVIGPCRDLQAGLNLGLRDYSFEKYGVEPLPIDERGDKDRAKSIAESLSADENVVLAVGHCQSTITKAMMPAYRRSQMPAVLAVPTANSLTSSDLNQDGEDTENRTLRMPPTDAEQALVSANYLRGQLDVKRIAVARGTRNPAYSDPLVDAFDRNVRELLVYEFPVGRGQVMDPAEFAAWKPDAIFFTGSQDDSFALLNQLHYLSRKPDFRMPYVLMTDAVVGSDFSRFVMKLPTAMREKIFISFQFPKPAQWSARLKKVMNRCAELLSADDRSQPLPVNGLSFCAFGYDAIGIAHRVIEDCYESGREVSRACVGRQINEYIQKSRSIDGVITRYEFGKTAKYAGNNKTIHFNIWPIDNFQLSREELALHANGL